MREPSDFTLIRVVDQCVEFDEMVLGEIALKSRRAQDFLCSCRVARLHESENASPAGIRRQQAGNA